MEDNSHMFDEDEAKQAKAKWTSMPGQGPEVSSTASFSAEVNDEIDYSNYGRPKYDPMTGQPLVRESSKGRAAMILGIISLVLFISYINVPLAILAIVLGILGRKSLKQRKQAIIGIVTGIISLALFAGSLTYISRNSAIADLMNDPDVVHVFGVDYLDEQDL